MFERTNSDSNPLRRGFCLALALLLLVAQSAAAAHYHQKNFRDNFTHSVKGDDALCSLCLFRFHAPANPGTPPSNAAPAVFIWRLTPWTFAPLRAAAFILLFSRAPPVPAL
jgi:hypothetical protein